ncbi:Alpha/Beta hydrolase protein, partial [Hypoxylon trugodes]|uniref:Alpha/Beta hydrolase protein n=1 Tax=Hypoxylon trugodes TaxID=326681 RepID=UPI00218DDBA5
ALAGEPFTHEELCHPGPDGAPLALSIFRPPQEEDDAASEVIAGRPCIVWTHGGGMLLRNRFIGLKVPLAWAKACGAVVVSVEYRVAPEHLAPAAVEDCYAALCWIYDADNAEKLGVDQKKLLLSGVSAPPGYGKPAVAQRCTCGKAFTRSKSWHLPRPCRCYRSRPAARG